MPSKGGANGAWELVGRYGYIDLDDQMVTGGELTDYVLGVNWHLNRNSRIMLSVGHGDLGGSRDGTAEVVQARWQIAF